MVECRFDLSVDRASHGRAQHGSNRCNAINLDIETSGPCGHLHEDASRWLRAEESCMDFIDDREHLDGGAVDVALEHLVERRSAGFDTELQSLQHAPSLLFDRRIQHFAGLRIEWRQVRHVKRVAVTRGNGGGRLPALESSRQWFNTDDLASHVFLLEQGSDVNGAPQAPRANSALRSEPSGDLRSRRSVRPRAPARRA